MAYQYMMGVIHILEDMLNTIPLNQLSHIIL